MSKVISTEEIQKFLDGRDEQKYIVNVEVGYMDSEVTVFYKEDGVRKSKKEPFYPFVWATQKGGGLLYKNDRQQLLTAMRKFGIACDGLNIYNDNHETTERMENGYRVLFYSLKPMSYNNFIRFFKNGGVDFFDDNKGRKQFLSVTPVEQFLIHTGKRFFKGYEDYDELVRVEYDLETDGLDPHKDRINQIGIRVNDGRDYIIEITGNNEDELRKSELQAIRKFFYCLKKIDPDVITGHNSENFDWEYLIVRCNVLGTDIKTVAGEFLGEAYAPYKKKKQTVLKLGGEVEYFHQTVMYSRTITDSLHAVRRAQAIDSNMKSANLKYVTKYSKLEKKNRVYVHGDKIKHLWADKSDFAFNDNNGDWYKITTEKPLVDGYEIVTGGYLMRRYLADDLYETDKVELTYNQSNFLLTKILPTTFGRACTMGTAGTWKLLMLAWSYENKLAVPMLSKRDNFTGGLSRLLNVGFVDDVVKLDFNSLYPAIVLTWKISPDLDISNVMLMLLAYILEQRELFKGLMKKAKKKVKELESELEKIETDDNKINNLIDEITSLKDEIQKYKAEANSNDKKQLPFKIFGNSFFGAFGAPYIYPWGDLQCAENITCIGRQSLRLMNRWFVDRGFKPIVMDTDGCNFQIPPHAKDYIYISTGANRNTVSGKEYKGVEGYVAEFNDLFMRDKMGLGIDEYAPATINFSRKNYADLLEDGSVKLVGNSIKSKTMPTFIEKFLDENMKLLLKNDGKTFLSNYYNYIEKIYNGNIPLREIASKGRIKKTTKEYLTDVSKLNKAGNEKGRQAWYELVIKDDVSVDMGDVVYYVNIGEKKGEGDVKKVPVYDKDENGNFITVDRLDEKGEVVLSKRGKPLKDKVQIGTDIVINCVRIDNEIIDAEKDIYGYEENLFPEPIIYNSAKYILAFNKKIEPLLVCFSPDIRDNILIMNPNDKQTFTDEESQLVSGLPRKEGDQDTFEELMQLSDREIKFWLDKGEYPVFMDDIGCDWDNMVKEYYIRVERLKEENIALEKERYNKLVDAIKLTDINYFYDNGEFNKDIMKNIASFLTLDNRLNFVSLKHDIIIGHIDDILNKNIFENVDDTEEVL